MALISSAALHDVSFAGSKVTIAGIDINNFMDDANPVEFQDVEVSSVGVNCNGVMIRNAKPSIVTMSVTVIPGTIEDKQLYDLWAKYRVQDGQNRANAQWSKALTGNITIGNGTMKKTSYRFSGGTMVSGPGGPVSNAEGKMQGRTYTFAFARVDV